MLVDELFLANGLEMYTFSKLVSRISDPRKVLEDFDFTMTLDGGFEYNECENQVHKPKMVLTQEVDTSLVRYVYASALILMTYLGFEFINFEVYEFIKREVLFDLL